MDGRLAPPPGGRSSTAVRSSSAVRYALLALAFGVFPTPAGAVSADEARANATKAITAVEAQASSLRRVTAETRRLDPSRLVTAGELHLRTKDYERAIDQLNKVIELDQQGRVPEAVAADATFLLAECQLDIEAWNDAKATLRNFIRRFPRSPLLNEARSKLSEVNLRH